MSDAFAIATLVAGVIGLGIILWAMRTGTADRGAEDEAREFHARHGHWPDETPQDAAARRSPAPLPVSEPDEHGRV